MEKYYEKSITNLQMLVIQSQGASVETVWGQGIPSNVGQGEVKTQDIQS